MSRSLRLFFAVGIATFLSPNAALAIVIATPPAGLSARAEVVTAGLSPGSVFNDSTNPATADLVFSNGGVSGESRAWATYGTLKASSHLSKGPAIENFNLGSGEATFSEVMTINGGTGPGTISFQFHITGSFEIPEAEAFSGRARSSLDVFFTDGTFQGDNRQYEIETNDTLRTIDDVFTTVPLNFTFGVPFSFDVRFRAEVMLEESDNGIATSDFFNTASVDRLLVEDANGPINATILTESGTIYGVPEPSAIALLLTGCCLAITRKR